MHFLDLQLKLQLAIVDISKFILSGGWRTLMNSSMCSISSWVHTVVVGFMWSWLNLERNFSTVLLAFLVGTWGGFGGACSSPICYFFIEVLLLFGLGLGRIGRSYVYFYLDFCTACNAAGTVLAICFGSFSRLLLFTFSGVLRIMALKAFSLEDERLVLFSCYLLLPFVSYSRRSPLCSADCSVIGGIFFVIFWLSYFKRWARGKLLLLIFEEQFENSSSASSTVLPAHPIKLGFYYISCSPSSFWGDLRWGTGLSSFFFRKALLLFNCSGSFLGIGFEGSFFFGSNSQKFDPDSYPIRSLISFSGSAILSIFSSIYRNAIDFFMSANSFSKIAGWFFDSPLLLATASWSKSRLSNIEDLMSSCDSSHSYSKPLITLSCSFPC